MYKNNFKSPGGREYSSTLYLFVCLFIVLPQNYNGSTTTTQLFDKELIL